MPPSRQALRWLRQPLCGLNSTSRVTVPTHSLFAMKYCRLTAPRKPFSLHFPRSLSLVTSTLWGDCSTCLYDSDPEWKCPATVAAYNDLLGNPGGNEADIIEVDGGAGTL